MYILILYIIYTHTLQPQGCVFCESYNTWYVDSYVKIATRWKIQFLSNKGYASVYLLVANTKSWRHGDSFLP